MSADRLVLAIDVGSSSIRCSAYRIVDPPPDDNIDNDSDTPVVPTVQAVEGCSVSKKLQAVQPNTGKINVYPDGGDCEGSSFDVIDGCVDDTLVKIRRHYRTNNNDGEEKEKKSFVVQGVGLSTFVMNLIAVDEDGTPVGNDATMSYACNTPDVVAECERLRNDLGRERLASLYQRTGAPLHSAYALPQLRAFYATQPSSDVKSRINKWTTIASICINRWTGGNLKRFEFPISPSEASWTGMYAFRGTDWDEEVMRHLPHEAREALPSPCGFDTVPDHLLAIHGDSPYWDRWPELRGGDGSNYGCRLTPGIGDGACANIGSKCTSDRRIAVTVGTSAAARIVLPLPVDRGSPRSSSSSITGSPIEVPPGLFCYRIDAHHVLVGGALTDGGSVVEWLRSIFKLSSDEAFMEVMARTERKYINERNKAEDDISALTTVPFLSGERSTGFRSGATGVLSGITRETTADDIIQSCLEGVILRLNDVINLIVNARQSLATSSEATSEERPVVIASGNGLVNNPLMMQMLADCSGLSVLVDAETSEATGRGAALMTAISLKGMSVQHGCGAHDAPTPTLNNLGEEGISTLKQSVPASSASSRWDSKSTCQDQLIDAMSLVWR